MQFSAREERQPFKRTNGTGRGYAWTNKNLNLSLTLYTKINPKWIMGLNIKQETTKFVGGEIGKTFRDLEQSS